MQHAAHTHLVHANLELLLELEVEGPRLHPRQAQLVDIEDRHVPVIEDKRMAQVVGRGAVKALLPCGRKIGRAEGPTGKDNWWQGGGWQAGGQQRLVPSQSAVCLQAAAQTAVEAAVAAALRQKHRSYGKLQ
jgi:hypothetical protein